MSELNVQDAAIRALLERAADGSLEVHQGLKVVAGLLPTIHVGAIDVYEVAQAAAELRICAEQAQSHVNTMRHGAVTLETIVRLLRDSCPVTPVLSGDATAKTPSVDSSEGRAESR